MSIRVATGSEAEHIAHAPDFREAWSELYRKCPYASVAQSPEYVLSWYEAFGSQFSPVLAYEYDGAGALEGLLMLANPRAGGPTVVPGDIDVPLSGWLARPLRGSFFIERALQAIKKARLGSTLHWSRLHPSAPRDWCSGARRWRKAVRVAPEPCAWVKIAPSRAKKKIEKKSNPAQLEGLKGGGELVLRIVEGPAERLGLFDLGAEWHDALAEQLGPPRRLAGDTAKRDFHRRLAQDLESLHVSVLAGNGRPASVVWAYLDHGLCFVDLAAFDPELERFSPTLLHLMLLEEQLVREDIRAFDVSTQPAWLRRLAENVQGPVRADVFLRSTARVKHRLGTAAHELSQWALRRLDSSAS